MAHKFRRKSITYSVDFDYVLSKLDIHHNGFSEEGYFGGGKDRVTG
jgi:hypothetical protein